MITGQFSFKGAATAVILGSLLTGCDDRSAPKEVDQGETSTQSSGTAGPLIKPWGYPLDALDRSTRPQDDLYRFANGGWLDSTEIPSDRSGVGFAQVMRDRNEDRIAQIIEDIAASDRLDGNAALIGQLYRAFMNRAAVEGAGLAPIRADLDRIAGAASLSDIAGLMMDPLLGTRALFRVGVGIDAKNPDAYTVYASHAGIALPDKSYYERDSERLVALRADYKSYMSAVFERLGHSDADARAEAVFALESAIAAKHWSRAERRNADRTYNPMSPAELAAFAPGFDWTAALTALGLDGQPVIVLREKSSFPALARLFSDQDVDVWRDYLAFHLVANHAPFLADDIAAERFAFFGTVLGGQAEQRPLEKRAIETVNDMLDQAVGKLYIDRFFPASAKAQVTEMFINIRDALSVRIDGLDWMTDATKKAAQVKLSKLKAKIAFPNVWTDYSPLTLSDSDMLENLKALREFDHQRDLARLGEPVNREEWFRAPQTVNAFYSPTRNEVFIPAGYIQSPLFDPNADPALNYGALGSIIGHEIGHGFDDQGSKYDGDGVLRSWWNEEDRAAFDALGDKLAAQFDEYEPIDGLNVNGRQTLGENIGDLAGMLVAFDGYVSSLEGKEPAVLDGFTGVQRFFLGRAQGRRYKRTEESLRRRLLSAPHSPMPLRVNGMARNMDVFYTAFDVSADDGMYLPVEERVRIW